MFTLAMLNNYNKEAFYTKQIDQKSWIVFNFCDPFYPKQCIIPNVTEEKDKQNAYAFYIHKDSIDGMLKCTPYTSDSKTSNFFTKYFDNDNTNTLNLTLTTKPSNLTQPKAASFYL